ncbi:hypothetical protein E1B28_006407 [Marasmius oreades]|uniref:Protein SMG7 n=1 Tax=Marasmius oreades TaxID=181124 RepID=A0A9P7S5M9_9AGAR|nr:uncharacterized protein E1B28_006407 [Marasmius oreades]KAG7095693.1 hypothetical protein E1B28_006407 [Marasmius oreades]
MTDLPSNIAREAKNIHQSVKELLKTREPFDKELDFQRKNLRRRYLNLLLVHPYDNESKDAETRLWMETSHAFISSYKQRISHLDRVMQKQQQQQGQQGANLNPHNQRGHGPVEHRKFIQRFRQFLAEEEKFWTQFVVRFTRSFDLGEAQSTLIDLGILTEELPIKELPTGSPDDGEGGPGAAKLPHNGGRNHFQFPAVPEGSESSFVPKTNAQRESRMEILSKALTCLGDIARYREQYNEAGGRPRAGYEDHSGPGRRGRFKKGGGGALIPDLPRPRNYEKARHCYEQAKLLVPHEGNPSHQLAILASYQKDMFTSLVHYYRALCVRHPYDSASDNIHTVLHKAIEQWKMKSKNEGEVDLRNAVGKIRIEAFKEKLVILHGLLRLGLGKNDALIIKQAQGVCADLYSLVSDRHLPEDFIIQVVVLSQAALWKHRMIRDSPRANKNNNDRHPESTLPGSLPNSVIEARLFTHLLSLHRALLEVGIEQLKEPAPIGPDGDLAQRIMVEFRRTLPALRIASKWLLANFNFVMQDPESLGLKNETNKGHKRALSESNGLISSTSTETIEFWEKYAEFLRVLSRAFPINKLPDLTFALSEDTEMSGFLPLKGMLDGRKDKDKEKTGCDTSTVGGDIGNEDCPTEEKEVHPNVVQLMRIKDLLSDAKRIVDMENSPLALYGNQFMLKGVEAQAQPVPLSDPIYLNDIEDDSDAILHAAADHDAAAVETCRVDDDPIRDAFSHLDGEDDEDDEDEIVWNPRASPIVSPRITTASAVSRVPPGSQTLPSLGSASVVPTRSPIVSDPPVLQSSILPPVVPQSQILVKTSKAVPPVALTTAEDLLNGFMGRGLSPSARMSQQKTVSEPLAPTAPLLFGDRTGNSIWSTSQDEQVSMRIAASTNHQQSFTHQQPISSQDVLRAKSYPHTQWPPSPSTIGHAPRSFTPQQLSSGIPPTTLYSSPSHLVGHHRRAPSSSAVAAQLFPDPIRNPGISEYGYASPHSSLNQQPIQQHLMEPDVFHQSYGNVNHHSFGHSPVRIHDSSVPNQNNYNVDIGFNNHHTRHLSLHDSKLSAQNFTPAMPPLWGSAG